MPKSNLDAIPSASGNLRIAIGLQLPRSSLALALLIGGMLLGDRVASAGPHEDGSKEIEANLDMQVTQARDSLATGRAALAIDGLIAARELAEQLSDPVRSSVVYGC
jgi:hypothetical protein